MVSKTTGSYSIDGGEAGKQRLDLLSEVLRSETLRLLLDAGLRTGSKCADLGCGGGAVTIEMARIVEANGHVTGLDNDESILELARADAKNAALRNVSFQTGNAESFATSDLDLVYARFLLSHLRDPAGMLSQFKTFVRPGGRVVMEDLDLAGAFCQPSDRAHSRFFDLYTAVVKGNSGDATLGARLPLLASNAGLADLGCRIHQPAHLSGRFKFGYVVTMERIKSAVVAQNFASASEVDSIVQDMKTFAADPKTLIVWPRVVQVWGTA